MTFVYILLLRTKNLFQALKQLEETTHRSFYNSVLLFSGLFSWSCTVYPGILAGSCWGEGQTLQDKNGLLSGQTPQLFLIFLSTPVL